MVELLSQRAYARRRGVSHTAVAKAVRSGRLKGALVEIAGGHLALNPELADAAWNANTDPSAQRERRAGGSSPESLPLVRQQPLFADAGPPTPGGGNGAQDSERRRDYLRASAARVTYQAQLAKLTYERESGKLVLGDAVRAHAFRVARAVRDRMLQLPDRLCAQLAAETDAARARALLRAEIESACAELARLPELNLDG